MSKFYDLTIYRDDQPDRKVNVDTLYQPAEPENNIPEGFIEITEVIDAVTGESLPWDNDDEADLCRQVEKEIEINKCERRIDALRDRAENFA